MKHCKLSLIYYRMRFNVDGIHTNVYSSSIQGFHCNFESLSFFPNQIGYGYFAIFQYYCSRRLRIPSQLIIFNIYTNKHYMNGIPLIAIATYLLFFLSKTQSWSTFLHQNARDSFGCYDTMR